jgi:mono/diheme cytochrome c family protein/uncharacterized membrane protein
MSMITPLLAVPASVWLELFGRLHVVFVHFPIALLLVAAMVEGWRMLRRGPGASPTAVICLAIGAASAILAAAMGWFHKAGMPETRMLVVHQWMGIATAIVAIIPLMLVGFQRWPRFLKAYRVMVLLCAVLVGITGHFGGELTHGEGYLTEIFHMPAEVATVSATTTVKLSDIHFPADGKIDYEQHVQPILAATCYECHGPAKTRGGLRLDSSAQLKLKGGDDGPAIVPGKSAQSSLITRIKGLGGDKRMPLNHPALTDEQIKILTAWIDQGAKFSGEQPPALAAAGADKQEHWAYNKPVRPTTVPVKDVAWVHNPIDNFILAKLEKEGMKPSIEADKTTLIRRVSLDLTGLPPTMAEVDAFLADTSPDAYEKVVDRLLASPHYGERMAVYWLDLVRFGDTLGIHSDTQIPITPYRDWVINAINSNMPYDRFTIDQLAGDLLPNPTLDDRVASAYNRLLINSEEGGAQPKEYIAKYSADRVRNVSSVWMGATMACCECHNHKFDPYSQKDFYRMAAFFADVQDNAVGMHAPKAIIPVPNKDQQTKIAVLDEAIAKLKGKLNVTTPELEAAQAKWEAIAKRDIQWTDLTPEKVTSDSKDSIVVTLPDKSIFVGGPKPPKDNYTFTTPLPAGKKITGIRIEVLPDISLPLQGPGRYENGNFALTGLNVSLTPAGSTTATPVALEQVSTDHAQELWPGTELVDGKTHNPGGWAILPEVGKPHELAVETTADVVGPGTLTIHLEQQLDGHTIGRFRISTTDMERPVGVAKLPDDIKKYLEVPRAKRRNKAREAVLTYYRSIAPQLDTTRIELAKVERDRAAILASARQCEVTEAGEPRVVRVLARGNWQDDSGEIMQPGVPHFLQQVETKDGVRATRLDLAHWITSTENPMTARVYVNRLWKMFYGIGLSKTLEDMGTQGEKPPEHPELLDWLATEFMQSGWDSKHMVRLLVTSSAYRQSSAGSKELREKDPFNRLVARQSSFRLEGEFIRDNALAMAGMLSLEMGGESVKPYQPAGYWEFLNFPPRKYENDHGAEGHRRTLYTWWQRTFLHPSLLNFDVPDREECTANRTISNTPLQALDLLNDPIYVEAARVFAQRIIKEGGSNDTDRMTWAYREALCRTPLPAERKVLEGLLDKHLKEYAADPKSAKLVSTNGEAPTAKDVDPVQLAAWTSVARTIINLHETVTRM